MKEMQNYSPTELVLEDIRNGASPEQIRVDDSSLSNYLNHLIGRRDIPLSILAELSGINRTTLYKILSGTINPGRNVVIRLALELGAAYDETQTLLKLANCAALSGTRRRDVFIINAIVHHQSVGILEDRLLENGLESIMTR